MTGKLDESWVSLETWSKETPVDPEQRSSVRSQIEDWMTAIVGLLEDANYVHGNLWMANVMIKKDANALNVIDFDWAGRAGEASYPFERNGDIRDWLVGSQPGGIISKGDDRAVLENRLPRLLS